MRYRNVYIGGVVPQPLPAMRLGFLEMMELYMSTITVSKIRRVKNTPPKGFRIFNGILLAFGSSVVAKFLANMATG